MSFSAPISSFDPSIERSQDKQAMPVLDEGFDWDAPDLRFYGRLARARAREETADHLSSFQGCHALALAAAISGRF